MKAFESMLVNSILDIIRVSSFRFGGLHISFESHENMVMPVLFSPAKTTLKWLGKIHHFPNLEHHLDLGLDFILG